MKMIMNLSEEKIEKSFFGAIPQGFSSTCSKGNTNVCFNPVSQPVIDEPDA